MRNAAMPWQPERYGGRPLTELVAHLGQASSAKVIANAGPAEKWPGNRLTCAGKPPLTIEWRTTWLTAKEHDTLLPLDQPDIDIPDITLEVFLGGGRQGWVYSGRVASTGALVAVKIIHGNYVQTGGRAAREALNLGRLRHPNIPRVFQFQPAGEFWVVIMELVQGEELRGCRLTMEQARRCFRQLADAVWTLGEAKIVHRDIKPANIVLRRQDQSPVLVDFGLAVDLSSPLPLKAENWLAGTPFFIAPEAFAGSPPTVAWDAYALGMTGVEILLEGEYPRPPDYAGLLAAKVTGDFDRGIQQALARVGDAQLREWCGALVNSNVAGRLAALPTARFWS